MTPTRTRQTQLRPVAGKRRDWRNVERHLREDGQPYSQGALALTYSLPNGVDSTPGSSALTLVHSAPQTQPEIPAPQAWAARFIQAVVEVVSSDRPLTQLVRWTDQRVYQQIAWHRQRVTSHRKVTAVQPNRQQVATVHVSQPSCDSAEVAARVSASGRSRAIAVRLDFTHGRWQCTAISFG